jgi:hypothetical protein
VSELAVDLLRQTRPWVMFLSILFFIASAFMVIAGLFMVGAGALSGSEGAVPAAVIGAIYIPFGGLYVYPAIKMWSYGSAIGRLLTSRATVDLEAALLQQKSLWKFSGIASIVMIALYVVGIIVAIAVGVASRMAM